MNAQRKLGIGALLGVLGGVGTALAPVLGMTALGRPWSFVAGFVVGVAAGLGVTLAIVGLVEMRRASRG